MDPIDPPPSNKRRPSWLRDTLEDAERPIAPRGTFCESKKLNRYQGYLVDMSTIVQSESGSFEEVIKHQVWKDAMHEEYESIMKNDVWEVVLRPRTNLLSPRNDSIRSSMDLMEVLKSTRQDSFLEASLKNKA